MMPDLHAWTVVAICNFTVVLSLDIIYHGLVKAFFASCHDFTPGQRLHVIASLSEIVDSHHRIRFVRVYG